MNKKFKKILMFVVFGFLFFATGCSTSSFCTAKDKENIRQAYAEKITIVVVDYYENEYHPEGKIPLTSDYSVVIDEAFVTLLDDEEILSNSNLNKKFDEEGFNDLFKLVHNEVAKLNNLKENEVPNIDVNAEKYLLTYTKLVEEQQFLYKNEKGKWKNPKTLYSNVQNNLWKANPQACLTNKDFEDISGATIEGKTWGDAWGEGLLEGLFVYPISAGLMFFTELIGPSGIGQFCALLIVTILVRLIMLLITFKSTKQSQVMQQIQPQMQELQSKFQNAKTPAEQQKYQAQIMKLYQDFNINPLAMLITPFITMPVFISVWGAIKGTTIIGDGTLFGLSFGIKLSTQIFDANLFGILIFLLMVVAQVVSMLLPQWLKNRKNKGKPKQKNPMNGYMIFMLVIMLWTGLFLPAGMAIYWTMGAVFSACQTAIFQYIGNKKGKGNKKYEKVYR